MQAIPTVYAGVRMRSRLEATWAAFFDLIGWRWSYEPIDLDGWIPDFAIETGWAEAVLAEAAMLAAEGDGRSWAPRYRCRESVPVQTSSTSWSTPPAPPCYVCDGFSDFEWQHEEARFDRERIAHRAQDPTPPGRLLVEVKPVYDGYDPQAVAAFTDMRRNRVYGLLLGVEPQGMTIGWFGGNHAWGAHAAPDHLQAAYTSNRAACSRALTFDLVIGESGNAKTLCHQQHGTMHDDYYPDKWGGQPRPPASEQLAALWARAKNATQWRAPRRRR